MIKGCLLLLAVSLALVACQFSNSCANETSLILQEGSDSATFNMYSDGDVGFYPNNNQLRMSFVDQRQGALKFYSQINLVNTPVSLNGLIEYDSTADTFIGQMVSGGNLMDYDLICDAFVGFCQYQTLAKRDVLGESNVYYKLTSVDVPAAKSFTLTTPERPLVFTENKMIACLEDSCVTHQIVDFDGKIVDAKFMNEKTLLLISNDKLSINTLNEFEIVDSLPINVDGSSWSLLSENTVIGFVEDGDQFKFVIAGESGVVSEITSVQKGASFKVSRSGEFNLVSLSTGESLKNYVCKSSQCKGISASKIELSIWDLDVAKTREAILVYAEDNVINVITCATFACKELESTQISLVGKISNLKVSRAENIPTIVFSIENGASGVISCFDRNCKTVSFTRVSDHVSGQDFSFYQTNGKMTIFSESVLESFSNIYASPKSKLCSSSLAGSMVVANSEVFACNRLPQPEGFSEVFFWTPFVTSVFVQNA